MNGGGFEQHHAPFGRGVGLRLLPHRSGSSLVSGLIIGMPASEFPGPTGPRQGLAFEIGRGCLPALSFECHVPVSSWRGASSASSGALRSSDWSRRIGVVYALLGLL